MSNAVIATSVLPDPTSPLQQSMHRDGARHVGGDGVDRRVLIAGELEGQRVEESSHEFAVDLMGDPRRLRLDGALPRDQADLHAQELVEPQPSLRPLRVTGRCGYVHVVIGGGAIDQLQLVEHTLGQRLRQRTHPLQHQRDQRLDLPRRHIGLARLRIDRHDHPGLGVTGAAEHVDDRVRELPFAAVHVELPVQRDLGSRRQLLLPPRLIEEDQVQQATAVFHHRFDHLLAVPGDAARDAAHFGHDRRFFAHLEIRDVGLASAVVIPARVVADEVEHALDRRRHRRQLVEHAGRDPRHLGERGVRQGAQSSGRGRNYSTPIRYG